nr:immunoglobulin heavy chain junction region [Mus musculus]MBK4185515.1 immunoglobulin heavy chain junction region [Mus musculus]
CARGLYYGSSYFDYW